MQEIFLHYLWQFQKLNTANLQTEQGNSLQVLRVGTHNTENSGPDFFNAQLLIANQKWAGNVEIHLKSSDWYAHNHEHDENYDSVILHVVWEDDVAVFDNYNNLLETLVLRDYVAPELLKNYTTLLKQKNWINCENEITQVSSFVISNWKEKLLIQRLHRKSIELDQFLLKNKNDWEELLFFMLVKNFGLKKNQDQFLQLARCITFKVFKKEMHNVLSLESLLFGQANLLEVDVEDDYLLKLKENYMYVKQKHQLANTLLSLDFFRLRPISFPTLRLSQLAQLYHSNQNLFSKIIKAKSSAEVYDLFSVETTSYWQTHYTFGKTSNKKVKKLSRSFIDLLIINVIIPIQYTYKKKSGIDGFEAILKMYTEIKSENNSIIRGFENLRISADSAYDSQSLIELKNEFCLNNKCLQCEIGNHLLYQHK